jgi:hypothetical protein
MFGGGVSAVLDDFRRIEIYRGGNRHVTKTRRDKGHQAAIAHFLNAVKGKTSPPDPTGYLMSSRASLTLVDAVRSGSDVAPGDDFVHATRI